MRAVDSNSEILGGNIQTPNLMVETGSDKLFNADTYAGEINVYGDMYMNNNATIYELRVDTDEWSMSPYINNVGYILDAIWTGHDWSLESLDERISDLESMI